MIALAQSIETRHLSAWYGSKLAIKEIEMHLPAGRVTALIGPSGCGKSTFIRCVNRMHETITGARVRGEIYLGDKMLLSSRVDPVDVRRRVAMVFQKPNPFPAMSIYDNVAIGPRLNGLPPGKSMKKVVEESLQKAVLWDEVKDRLHTPGSSLSGGQQQRLCIARALALEPEVLLLDEPCSALDPISTMRIEELISELKEQLTIIIVTHNMQQAARVADLTAFFLLGELIEFDTTEKIFTAPADSRTEDYITGRFG